MTNDQSMSKRLTNLLAEDCDCPRSDEDIWLRLEADHGFGVYCEILFLLTRMEFTPEDAKVNWCSILEHRCHLCKCLGRDPGLRVALCDYFVNISPKVKEPVIVEVHLLEEHILKDELTGLYNRRFFNDELPKEVERFRRFGHPFSLLMVDVDHFKRVNDTYGHLAGDRALKEIGQTLVRTARIVDHVARYGGEEFAVILPNMDKDQAMIAAERLRSAVEQHEYVLNDRGLRAKLTISIGVACFPTDAFSPFELIQRADEALYRAKKTRNVVSGFSDRQRRFPRVPGTFIVREQEGNFSGTTQNISLGGVLLISDTPLSFGKDLVIELRDQNEKISLSIKARTVRVEPDPNQPGLFQLGLAFELQDPADQRRLIDMINKNDESKVQNNGSCI